MTRGEQRSPQQPLPRDGQSYELSAIFIATLICFDCFPFPSREFRASCSHPVCIRFTFCSYPNPL
jgi:hypothetical protein